MILSINGDDAAARDDNVVARTSNGYRIRMVVIPPRRSDICDRRLPPAALRDASRGGSLRKAPAAYLA